MTVYLYHGIGNTLHVFATKDRAKMALDHEVKFLTSEECTWRLYSDDPFGNGAGATLRPFGFEDNPEKSVVLFFEAKEVI